MRKMKLDTDELRVESFQASTERRPKIGTVRGNAITPECTGEDSCGYVTNCQDTCFCADTSPRPSCDECSWDGCPTFPPECP